MRQTPQERGWDFKEGPVLCFTMMRHFYHIKRPPWEKKIHTHKYIQTSLLNHRKNDELVLLLRIRQSQGTAC